MFQRVELGAGRWETLEKVDREIKSWCSRHVALLCVNNATLRSCLRCNTLVNVTEFSWRHHGKLRQRGGGETGPAFNSIYSKSKRSESSLSVPGSQLWAEVIASVSHSNAGRLYHLSHGGTI